MLSKFSRICHMGRRHRKQRTGAAVVEFAIVAPVFFLFVFGIIEFGRMLMVQQTITHAAREGARVAALDGSTVNSVETAVNSYLSSALITEAAIEITPNPPSDAADGQPVSVSVTVGFDQVSWLPAPMFLGSTPLTASTVMRRESP